MANSGRRQGDPYGPLQKSLNGILYVSCAKAMGDAIALSTEPLPEVVRALGTLLKDKNLRTRKMRNANMRIARAARDSMASGFESRLPDTSHHGYRVGKKRLSGRLGPLLHSDQMIEGTSDRVISFINEAALGTRAAHWGRVNYGTTGRGGAAPAGEHTQAESFGITLMGAPLLTLRDPGKPGYSTLPQFFYFIPKGNKTVTPGAELHVIKNRGKPARVNEGGGTRAARYTDLGLKVVAEKFPNAYMRLFRSYADDHRTWMANHKNYVVPMDIRKMRISKFKTTSS
jgi:hypothetical protein